MIPIMKIKKHDYKLLEFKPVNLSNYISKRKTSPEFQLKVKFKTIDSC